MAANSLTNAAAEATEMFFHTLGNTASSWRDWAGVINADAASLKRADISGINAYDEAGDSDTAEANNALSSSASTTTVKGWEKLVTVTELEVNNTPGILTDIAGQMAEAAAHSIAARVYSTLAGLNATAHPDTSIKDESAGAANFCDTFDSTNSSQKNLYTGALTRANLSTMLEGVAGYKNKAGLEMNLQQYPLQMIVPVELATTAIDILGLDGPTYDGTSLASGSFGARIAGLTVAPYLSDANDFFITTTGARCPLKVWVRNAPSIRVTPSPSSGRVHLYGYGEWEIVLEPSEAGMFMAVVS